jgi:hypothetical protein
MTTITLPPLPVADPELVKRFGPPTYTLDQLRARDLEVARVVLEGAAKCCEKKDYRHESARAEIGADIRALEVKHHE